MLTILFLASNPYKTERLKLDRECREIKEKIKLSENREQLNFISEWAVKIKYLQDFIKEQNPDIIHFSGHGENAEIILEGEDGKPVSVPKKAIVRLLGRCKNLKLVVFNTCYSVSFAQETVEKIDFAIGMDGSVVDDTAITFAYRFYSSLGCGETVEDSFEDALTEIDLNNLSGSNVPKLFMKRGIDKSIVLIKKEEARNNDSKSTMIINLQNNSGQINTATNNSVINVVQNNSNSVEKDALKGQPEQETFNREHYGKSEALSKVKLGLDVMLDIATLRAAKSVIDLKVRNKDYNLYDIDISCLSTIVDAIILFDNVYVPNIEHNLYNELLVFFGESFKKLPVEGYLITDINKLSKNWVEQIQIEDIVESFGAFISYRGFGISSDYLLLQSVGVYKNGDLEKYNSNIIDYIKSLISKKHRTKLDRLFWKFSKLYESYTYTTDSYDVKTFLDNLAWLAYRTRCYHYISRDMNIDYMPHPLRSNICAYSIGGEGIKRFISEGIPHINSLEKFYREAAQIKHVFGDYKFASYEWPTLLPYLLKRVENKNEIIDIAYQIRNERGAKNLRKIIGELSHEYYEKGNLKYALQMNNEIIEFEKMLRKECDLGNTSKLKISIFFEHFSKPRLYFLKNIFNELVVSSSLGASYEKLIPTNTKC
jgi:hypothetical protein